MTPVGRDGLTAWGERSLASQRTGAGAIPPYASTVVRPQNEAPVALFPPWARHTGASLGGTGCPAPLTTTPRPVR